MRKDDWRHDRNRSRRPKSLRDRLREEMRERIRGLPADAYPSDLQSALDEVQQPGGDRGSHQVDLILQELRQQNQLLRELLDRLEPADD